MPSIPIGWRGRLALAAAASLFVLAATANAGGYRFGVSDQAFYIPAVAITLDPSLFPHDRAVLAPQMRLWLGQYPLAWSVTLMGGDMPAAFAAVYVATLLLLFGGGLVLARRLGCSWWAVAVFLAILALRHRITKTGANSLEGYMHPRMLAFALGVAALACLPRKQFAAAALWTLAAAVIHTTTALWFALVLIVAIAWSERRLRSLLPWAAGAGVLALGATYALPSGVLAEMDAPWLAVLGEKDYLFPAHWPAYAWLVNLAYPVVLVALHRRRLAQGRAAAGEGALIAGLVGLVALFLASVPLTESHVALAIQFQVNRVFWLLDVVTTVLIASWLADDLAMRFPSMLRPALASTLIAASLIRGYYVVRIETHRPLVETRLPATSWTDVMAWLRTQPRSWRVLADSGHAWKFGSSVRVAAARDTLLEAGKDTAFAIYDRTLALDVAERAQALALFETFSVADLRSLRERYDLDVLVDRSTRTFALPVLYRNDEFVVYDIR